MPLAKWTGRRELWLWSALILLGALVASPGFFSIDEAIYYLGARAVAEWGSLGLENGYHQFHSESLRLRFLIDGPQGLTPQYPAGSAILGGLLIPFLGPRAFVLLNALAAVATLFTVRKICLREFNSETVARIALGLLMLGTFWVEYALGVWPHMLSTFFAVQAYWFALRHLETNKRDDRDAILSGLFAGAGMLFRLDAIFAVPAIGLILVMFAPRMVRSCVLFGLAVLPSIALASWLNVLKFGTWNPFSYGRPYGQSGGNIDLSSYWQIFAAICLVFAAVFLWRKVKWKISRKAAIASLAIVCVALFLIPATNAWLIRFWNGFLALVVDLRNIQDSRSGVEAGPGGTLLFWDLVKKSLGHSMPWLGLMAILLTGGIRQEDRRFVVTLLTFIVVMIMPFIMRSWHGGGGNNMRYFLPVLPPLCILCARLIYDLWRSVPDALAFFAGGIWAAIAGGVGWAFLHPSGYAGVQQIVATYVLLATAAAAMAAGASWRYRRLARGLAIALFGGGCLIATTSAISDVQVTEKLRIRAYAIGKAAGDLPARSLFITNPEWGSLRLPGHGVLLAARDPETQRADSR
ncbi:MAG TPA: glycosyltransferase family 39 protein, partial [Sphingomicrobium sp.]|nr:glycosyltransferase family 39 protein [Sphingomicrobium sp.]